MINVNPHEGRFESFNALPHINSKFKTAFRGQSIKNHTGRENDAKCNGYVMTIHPPNCPANTNYYSEEVPRFYPGQPGFKKHLKDLQSQKPVAHEVHATEKASKNFKALYENVANEKPEKVVKETEKTFEISDKTFGIWNEDEMLEAPKKRKVTINSRASPRKNLKNIELEVVVEEIKINAQLAIQEQIRTAL